jgi:hypothetical protein
VIRHQVENRGLAQVLYGVLKTWIPDHNAKSACHAFLNGIFPFNKGMLSERQPQGCLPQDFQVAFGQDASKMNRRS